MAVEAPRTRHHDVIVIGAGHNGLVAANYLQDAGLNVLVVEADTQIGGMTSSRYSIPGAPAHLVNHCAVDPILWSENPPAKELALEEYGLRMVDVDPPFAYLGPDGESIAFWRDARKTAREIEKFSREDAAAYLEFAAFLDDFFDVFDVVGAADPVRPGTAATRIARAAFAQRRQLGAFAAFALASGKEVINERFRHPVVRAAMHVASGATMSSSHPGSAIQFLLLAAVHRNRCWRPIGGTQAIPDALARRLQARGGSIIVNAPVAEITLSGGRADGVVLGDGTVLRAERGVVASCDPSRALGQFLPPGSLPAELERRVNALPANGFGWGQMKIDVACAGRLDLSRHEKRRDDGLDLRIPSHWIGTEKGIERAYGVSAGGLMPDAEDLVFYNAIPTGPDPTQAPDGQDTLYAMSVAIPNEPAQGWDQLKDKAAAVTMGRLNEFYGNLADIEIDKTVETHEDFAALRHATGGCPPHVDQVLGRLGPLRPALGLGGYRTPIDGLFLAGSGSHPGGSVTGLPGYLGARAAIRDLKKKSRRGRR
ncbi:phytoene desaturase family protein [Mycobacterium sp.]|uniref:phytoene desaturase family protein n=1 Tax=Mycobacterium sp. TaxID=1785 RepID=UPI002D86F80F|nr:NAD(P)/FAD-dependent oxidoreductase [Mycobacterium sp.]